MRNPTVLVEAWRYCRHQQGPRGLRRHSCGHQFVCFRDVGKLRWTQTEDHSVFYIAGHKRRAEFRDRRPCRNDYALRILSIAGLGAKRSAAPPLATPPCEAGPPSRQGVVSSRSNRQSASIESLEQNRVRAGKSDLCSSWSAAHRERKTRTWLHGHRWAPPAGCLGGSQ